MTPYQMMRRIQDIKYYGCSTDTADIGRQIDNLTELVEFMIREKYPEEVKRWNETPDHLRYVLL